MDTEVVNSNTNFSQKINFQSSETDYSSEILAQEVTINCSDGNHNHGSSKVKLTNVVDYQWELRFYIGQLIAIHVGGKIFAYAIKGKDGGLIRVINRETDQRKLIKNTKALIQDISFALTPLQILLGCVDEEGNLSVYNIDDTPDSIVCTLLLNVVHPTSFNITSNYRVIWCQYVPSYGEEADTLDDPAKLLALLNGNKVEVWDVSVVNSKYGSGPLQPSEKYEGYVEIDGHMMNVIDASFSPDGTAIATASLDGYVKFFQVYMVESEKPRCLHQWQPHDGKALSSLIFLDNVNQYGSDSMFWKFAITGAVNNSELKVWSCESWTCLQTLHFVPNPNSPTPELFFKARLDMTANYLIVSDINNRILYVLEIQKNDVERVATISRISEFLLPAPCMSFCIINANKNRIKYTNSEEELYRDDVDDYEEDDAMLKMAVCINLYIVQPKKLQICNITFQTDDYLQTNVFSGINNQNDAINKSNGNNKSDDEDEEEDELEEDEEEEEEECTTKVQKEITNLDDLQSSVALLIQQQQQQHQNQPQPTLNLMTPDDFNSPVINTSPNNARNSIGNTIPSPSLIRKSIEKLNDPPVENLIDFQQPQKENVASGGSSPSREVQEILSLQNPPYHTQEFFDNIKLPEEENEKVVEQEQETIADKSKEVVWPDIPVISDMKYKEEFTEESKETWNKVQLQMLNYKINAFEYVLNNQSEQIRKLQTELQNQVKIDDIRNVFVKEMEVNSSKNQAQLTKIFESFTKEQKRREKELYDDLLTNTTQQLTKEISDNLQNIISQEIKTTILPPVLSIFENLQHQIDVHYSQKLNTIDHLLKSNISKLVGSKTIADSLSVSIINVIKPSLETCYKDMISNTLIPSWEKVCNSMFQQIHNTFTQGTKEYTSSVETYMDRQRRVQDKGKDLIIQMQNVSESMKMNADKLNNTLSYELQKQFTTAFNNMQEKFLQNITELVKEQVKIGFKTHAAVLEDSVVNAVRSRAVTPSPHVIDTQVQLAQIQHLLAKGNIDVAFQQALSASASASDLTLVLYVCEKVNPQEVFGQGNCLLQQHVLLSLIQQLGADLTHHTEIKHRYLEEALLNLEVTNQVTKEHVPTVLKELSRQLNNFITSNQTHKNVKHMKMLLMATHSLLRS